MRVKITRQLHKMVPSLIALMKMRFVCVREREDERWEIFDETSRRSPNVSFPAIALEAKKINFCHHRQQMRCEWESI